VLLAEDEALVRAVATAALEEAGFSVLAAVDAARRAVFLEHIADVRAVLLDLAMPKTDGLKVLREIRRLRPEVR